MRARLFVHGVDRGVRPYGLVALEAEPLLHHVERAVLHLGMDAADIKSDDACHCSSIAPAPSRRRAAPSPTPRAHTRSPAATARRKTRAPRSWRVAPS